jgi:hypothetical protein
MSARRAQSRRRHSVPRRDRQGVSAQLSTLPGDLQHSRRQGRRCGKDRVNAKASTQPTKAHLPSPLTPYVSPPMSRVLSCYISVCTASALRFEAPAIYTYSHAKPACRIGLQYAQMPESPAPRSLRAAAPSRPRPQEKESQCNARSVSMTSTAKNPGLLIWVLSDHGLTCNPNLFESLMA